MQCNSCKKQLKPSNDIFDVLFWDVCLTDRVKELLINTLRGVVEIREADFICLIDVDEDTRKMLSRLVEDIRFMRLHQTQPLNTMYIEKMCMDVARVT